MFEITKDNINTGDDAEHSRVGWVFKKPAFTNVLYAIHFGEPEELPEVGEKIKFRLRDEDHEVHYEGLLHDDPDCLNQCAAQEFGEKDTGAWICEVLRDGEWKIEVS